jgi:hypothetical protein
LLCAWLSFPGDNCAERFPLPIKPRQNRNRNRVIPCQAVRWWFRLVMGFRFERVTKSFCNLDAGFFQKLSG